MSTPSQPIVAELDRIAQENGGLLIPALVVEAAAPESSPLHSWFNWNDKTAAHAYRLEQARQLIRLTIHILPNGSEAPRFVSLSMDRKQENGGYRRFIDVMSDKDMRKQLLLEAKQEMDLFVAKYAHLQELAKVISAMRRAKA